MPLYRLSSDSTSTTDPVGSSSGSDAATPLCAATPDAVVTPLQYAVALNASRAPGIGTAVVSRSTACRAAYFESSVVTSYSETKPITATTVTTLLRQKDLEMIMQSPAMRTRDAHCRWCAMMSWIRRRLVTNASASGYASAANSTAAIIEPTVYGHSRGFRSVIRCCQNSAANNEC